MSESDPIASVYVELVSGILRKEVIVIATVSDDTASGSYILQAKRIKLHDIVYVVISWK